MKSHYFIKPIRIRFMSGGVECSNMEQLRHNFSPVGVIGSFSEFQRWVNQNRKEENEIETIWQELIKFKNEISIDSPISLFVVYKIIFKKYIEEHKIENLVDLFHYWNVSQEYRLSFKQLKKDIKNLPWNEAFYYNVAEKAIKEKGLLSEEQLYSEYENYLNNDFIKSEGKDLISIYLYLAKRSDYKESFSFLEGIIRKNRWHINFFLQLIPCLFVKSTEDQERLLLPDYANLNFSLETEDCFFYIYCYYLGGELKKRKIKALPDLFLLFISNAKYKQNFDTIHEIIKDAQWSLDFAYRTIPQLLSIIHRQEDKSEIFINEMFSNEDAYKLFHLYHFFLSDYLWKNDKICILKFLYLFWDGNKECLVYFNQLHNEIVSTTWGKKFLDEFFGEIVCAHLNVSCLSYDKCSVLDEKTAFYFFSKHYQYYLNEKKINNISDLYICWCKDAEYKELKCFEFLDKLLKNNLWGVWKMLDIYEHHRDLHNNSEWINILTELSECETEKKHHLFKIGKIFIDDYNIFDEGYTLIREAEAGGDKDAELYHRRISVTQNSVSPEFSIKYRQRDKAEWENNRIGNAKFPLMDYGNTFREKWLLATQALIHKCIGEERQLYEFVGYIRELKQNKDLLTNYDFSPSEFLSNFDDGKYDAFRINKELMNAIANYNGKFMLEIRFVFGLLCRFSNESQNYKKEGYRILSSIKDIYLPANYIINEELKEKTLDKENFREKLKTDFNSALKYYCLNMVDFVK